MRCNGFLFALAALFLIPASAPAVDAPKLSDVEQEQFLKSAKIIKTAGTKKGVTNSQRVTMTDGNITHDAHVQCIDEAKHEFTTDRGTELNFKDSYKFNIAGYRLARLLGIGNVPVYTERKIGGKSCSVSWWIDDVIMDEADRRKKKIDPPDPAGWNNEIYVMRVFDQLIFNVDRNLTNVLIVKSWDMWMIDMTRSFRLMHTLENSKNLGRCDRTLLANLRSLDGAVVQKALTSYCTKGEIDAVMARRDVIVKFFDDEVKQKGESTVLYDLGSIKNVAAVQQ